MTFNSRLVLPTGVAAGAVGVLVFLICGAVPAVPDHLPAHGVPSAVTTQAGSLGPDDGYLDDQRVPVDADLAAITRLDPDLQRALVRAARAAARDDVTVEVTSGWRSKRYQQRLLDDAVASYGSREEALRWVATPDTSAHVVGDAVDVGPTDAAYWMSRYGSQWGLCQTFANEIWHYELSVAPGDDCPVPAAGGVAS